jgi:hypothetical protein
MTLLKLHLRLYRLKSARARVRGSTMPSPTIDAVNAHRAAWQAFQDAPADEKSGETIRASCRETEALEILLSTIPTDMQDMQALRAHLDWWVLEEAQRRGSEPAPFVLQAIIRLTEARERDRCEKVCVDRSHRPKEMADQCAEGSAGSMTYLGEAIGAMECALAVKRVTL